MEIIKEWMSVISSIIALIVTLCAVTPKGINAIKRIEASYLKNRLKTLLGEDWIQDEIAEHARAKLEAEKAETERIRVEIEAGNL